MHKETIDIQINQNKWFLQIIYSAILFLATIKLTNTILATTAVATLNALLLSKPKSARINIKRKTLTHSYRKPYSLIIKTEIDLSKYSRIHSQIESHAGRSLNLSGPGGEHLVIAKFDQNPSSANQHIQEVAQLRKNLANALGLHDGGEA
ncbi:MAG TPA: hypothetical protein VER09_06640 [Pseudomonas sp.]|nr:hypothetical protein [Pseudomonas sp.]